MYEIHIKLATGPKAEGQRRQWLTGHRRGGGREGATLPIEKSPQLLSGQPSNRRQPGRRTERRQQPTDGRPIDPPNGQSDQATNWRSSFYFITNCATRIAQKYFIVHTATTLTHTHTHTTTLTHTQKNGTHTHSEAHTMLNCNGRRWSRIGIWYLPHTAHTFTYPHTDTHGHTQRKRHRQTETSDTLPIVHRFSYISYICIWK